MGLLDLFRRQDRTAWKAAAMKGSFMQRPVDVFVEGQPVVEETVPYREPQPSETFVQDWKARKKRQQEHAQKMAVKRAHERAAQEVQRRSEVDAAIRKAYASLEKDVQNG